MEIQPRERSDEQFSHRHIDVGEVRLHVAEAGAARGRPLVVLLHGFPEFWWSWRHQLRALADAGFHVVAPDLRGYNLSDKPKDIAAYSMKRVVEDVRGLIRACGQEKAVVIGHDWGGGLAWSFAMAYPEMVHRLGILNAPHPLTMMRGLRRPKQMKKSWYIFLFALPFLPERLIQKRDWIRRTFARDGFDAQEIERYADAMAQPGALRGGVNYYRAMLRDMLLLRTPKLRRVDVPTLVVWGERDSYLGVEMATPPVEWVPNVRVEFLPDATHWVQHDAPERVNELLGEFIADLRTGTKPS